MEVKELCDVIERIDAENGVYKDGKRLSAIVAFIGDEGTGKTMISSTEKNIVLMMLHMYGNLDNVGKEVFKLALKEKESKDYLEKLQGGSGNA